MRMTMIPTSLALVACCGILIAGCSWNPKRGQGVACANGLKSANRELQVAQVKGFGGTVAYGKAATLLAAAKVQQQFDKYPNCIEKVNRARAFIRQSRISD